MKTMAEFQSVKELVIHRNAWHSECALAFDAGGSLVKIAYVLNDNSSNMNSDQITIHLLVFEAENLDACLEYVKTTVLPKLNLKYHTVRATGVGCFKFKQKFKELLRSRCLVIDDNELNHAINGLAVIWNFLKPSSVVYNESHLLHLNYQTSLKQSGLAPCVLVNLGSAMTAVKVHGDGSPGPYVGACTLGGLSFMGLGSLLVKTSKFQELLHLAEEGDYRNVDLLVKDTAGENYRNAPPEGHVSSFGKAATGSSKTIFTREDLASSALYAVTDNLATQAFFIARCEGVQNVLFCGSFFRNNQLAMKQITEKFLIGSSYLGCSVRAIFLRNETYLGALGLLLGMPSENCRDS